MSFPLVSIIVPSLNQGKFIAQTIDSVLNQSYKNIECLIIDGGSTDNTLEILKSYKKRISFVSEKDHGQSDAINKGLNLARGDILSYLNSDDILFENSVSTIVSAFSTYDRLWVTGDYDIVNEIGRKIQSAISWYKRIFRSISSRNLLYFTNYIIQPGTFWKRDLQEKIGMFDTSLVYAMDYDFWLRAYQQFEPLIIKSKLSAFRIHSKSKGGKQYAKQFDEELEVLKRYCTSKFFYIAHSIHNKIITLTYKMIK